MIALLRILPLLIALYAFCGVATGQQFQLTRQASHEKAIVSSNQVSYQAGLRFPDYPLLELPEGYENKALPPSLDNSVYPFLRPVFAQMGASCGQSASVAYDFCYEINRLRNIPSQVPENQYPSHFTWNFMNAGLYYGIGVSYFHSFEVLKAVGCPNEATYGPITMDDPYYWMSGYEKYKQAMHNRISAVHSIPVGTTRGLLTLKNWLNDHLEGSDVGGVANFYTGIGSYTSLPMFTPEGGKKVIITWNPEATHALTIVGYNDSVRYDLNGDGKYTNNLDINADGTLDMKDWEIGAVKFVNSYGSEWADDGFCYALYSTLAMDYGNGGIWNNAVHVITAEPSYTPLLTLKATISHTARGRIRIRAGVNNDTSAYYPAHVLDFPVFDYQGGDNYMQGSTHEEGKVIEIGLDITPLLGFLHAGASSKVYLIVDENDPDNMGSGTILQYSVLSYLEDTTEYSCDHTPFMIVNNGTTWIAANISPNFPEIELRPEELHPAVVGMPYMAQMQADSGTPPYAWELLRKYQVTTGQGTYQVPGGQKLDILNAEAGMKMLLLPFSFPFYGQTYDTLYVHTDGYVAFQPMNNQYPYLGDEQLFLRQIQAIACLMNQHQNIGFTDGGVWYEPNSAEARIAWNTSTPGSQLTNQYSITLHRDGTIECSYGEQGAIDARDAVTGISNGEGTNYQEYDTPGSGMILPGNFITWIPASLPAKLNITSGGLILSDTVIEDLCGDFDIRVTDARHISRNFTYNFSTGPLLEVTVNAGADNLIVPGEDITLNVTLQNKLTQQINNLNLHLSTPSPLVVIRDSLTGAIDIPSGEQLTIQDAFSFHVEDSVTQPGIINLAIRLNWNGKEVIYRTSCRVSISHIELTGPYFLDEPQPGAACNLLLKLSYPGIEPLSSFRGKLSCSDPYISIDEPSDTTFQATSDPHFLEAPWSFVVNQNIPGGRIIKFLAEAYNAEGDTLRQEYSISIGTPSAIIIDLDKNSNSAVHLRSAIKANGILPKSATSIDSSLVDYRHLFLCLGTRASNTVLSDEQADYLNNFLQDGGNIYMEGGSTFGGDHQTELHSKFRVTGSKMSWSKPADTLVGCQDSFMEGIQLKYLGEHVMQYCLIPLEPAVPIFKDKITGYNFVVANDSLSYRTIASSIEFGGTYPFNSPGRAEIMKRYLTFFELETENLAANFQASEYEACSGVPIHFVSYSAGNPTSYNWTFQGGIPAESNDPEVWVKWDQAGAYNVTLTVSDGITSNTLQKTGQIKIFTCGAITEPYQGDLVGVFPNPAHDEVTLITSPELSSGYNLQLTDLQGRVMKNLHCPSYAAGKDFVMSLSGIRPGMYILSVQSQSSSDSVRLLVY